MYVSNEESYPIKTVLNNSIHVWHTNFEAHCTFYKIFQSWLAEEEKIRAEKLKSDYRQNFILGRGVLRSLLAHYTGQIPKKITFSYTPSGKPMFIPPYSDKQVEFNISHSRNKLALAFTLNTSIGVDLEYKSSRKYMDKIAYRFLASDNYERLQRLNGKRKINAFFNAWVRHEATLKALGSSLKTHPLSHYLNKPIQNSRILIQEKNLCSLSNLELHPDFAAALAIQGANKAIIVNQY